MIFPMVLLLHTGHFKRGINVGFQCVSNKERELGKNDGIYMYFLNRSNTGLMRVSKGIFTWHNPRIARRVFFKRDLLTGPCVIPVLFSHTRTKPRMTAQ